MLHAGHVHVRDASCLPACLKAGAGPGLSFARELLRRGFAQEVGLVPCACGGSELCCAGETPRRRLSFTGAWDELGSELARWEEGGEWCEAAVWRG